MITPMQFLAYYGGPDCLACGRDERAVDPSPSVVLTQNESIVQASYDQCRLYRNALRGSSGLWAHITGSDPGLWATGPCDNFRDLSLC